MVEAGLIGEHSEPLSDEPTLKENNAPVTTENAAVEASGDIKSKRALKRVAK